MIKFLADNIWTTIKSFSKRAKRTKIAVAYFGTGAATQVHFKSGDILLVAMTLYNVKAGQVNPFEIEKLYKSGVAIFNLPNLHSKIYLFDKKVIIGSANVSTNSADTLIETALLTDDRKAITHADSFIKEHCIEKVDEDYIEICKKNYKRPKFFGNRQKRTATKFKGQLSRLWVISTRSSKVNNDISPREEKQFDERVSNKRVFNAERITYPPGDNFINQVKEGDILFEIYNRKKNSIIYAPKRTIGVAWNKPKTHKVLIVEERKQPKTNGWKVLERKLRQQGIKGITKNSTREIKNDNTKKILHNYFN